MIDSKDSAITMIDPEQPAQVDIIQNGQAFGSVAQRLLETGMGVNALRAWVAQDGRSYMNHNGTARMVSNATLRKDEWKQYDDAVISAAQDRLVGVNDLMSRGLVHRFPNGLGKTVLEYEDVSDTQDAEVNMDGVTRGDNDTIEYQIKYLPLPIVHKSFQINIRKLSSSRTLGEPLDTTQAQLAAQKVADKVESMLFTGLSSYAFGGGTIFGYQDQTNRNTVSLAQNWDASGKTGAEILTDVLDMKQAAINDKKYGPFMLYIPTAYETALDDSFSSNYPQSIRQRIEQVSSLQGITVADKLSANNVVLVQLTSDVARMVEGLPITTVEWQTEGNMIFHFKVMAILIPQVRADQENLSGIVHLS